VVRETLLALLVLALTFLNFGHSSAVFASGGRVVLTGVSICGDQSSTIPGDHFACHACRQDIPALPPAPIAIAPVQFGVTPVAYVTAVPSAFATPLNRAASPRGPPTV